MYFQSFLLYVNDVIYQFSVILIVNWDQASALLWYNLYVAIYTILAFPIFLYDLGKIYWLENEFEYVFNGENFLNGIFTLVSMTYGNIDAGVGTEWEDGKVLNRPKWKNVL